jgi:hypothetical protein
MRRQRRAVPQVGRQQRELDLDISAGSVPAQQGIDSKAMTLRESVATSLSV